MVDNVSEYTVVMENSLAIDAAALVSVKAPLLSDGEWDCPYNRESCAHKKLPLSNYGLINPIGGDCNDSKSLLDTLPLS